MIRHRLALVAVLALTACGNDTSAGMGGLPIKALAQATWAQVSGSAKRDAAAAAATPAAAPDPAAIAASRKALEDAGVPIYIVQAKSLGFIAYFGILGKNGDVTTWSTPDYTAISLRDDLLVATRGFGPDIMSSSGPEIDVLRAAKGPTQRSYFYLDGADQTRRLDFDCNLTAAGSENLTIIGKTYPTKRVDEACSGPSGSFTNSFWFDTDAKLRQSSQLLAPGIENLLLQKIID
jgi:Group 4 capsule polysaccharide lipoprotein gfcB, YjbF